MSHAPSYLQDLFPRAAESLRLLYASAVENAGALAGDFHSMRDWLDLSSCESESLQAALLLLLLAREEGSLCVELSRDNLVRRLQELVPQAEADAWAEQISCDVKAGAFPTLIGAGDNDTRPIVLRVREGRSFLYFQKLLRHERLFTHLLQERLRQPLGEHPGDSVVLKEVLEDHPIRLGGAEVHLDEDQRQAVKAALREPLLLISGGPGTGKTSIVVAVLRCLTRLGIPSERLALAAPTGRAAQRLAESIRHGLQSLGPDAPPMDEQLKTVEALTLHHLLSYVPNRDIFRRHAESPIPADVVIVDEASMVGLVMMSHLLQALSPTTRLILLGDKDQLPSVEAGAALANLVDLSTSQGFSPRVPVLLLRTNHRAEPRIHATARAINEGRVETLDALPRVGMPSDVASWPGEEQGCRLLELKARTPGEVRRIVNAWADHAYVQSGFADKASRCTVDAHGAVAGDATGLSELFEMMEQYRLLTLVREGPWGCEDVNRRIERFLRPRAEEGKRGLFVGALALVTRNDPVRRLFNGDVGLTLRSTSGGLRVVFRREAGFLSLPADSLPAHELGFAITVHKSQGSEYGEVLVVAPPEGGRKLLTRELLYTAITRAKKLAILCGTHEALEFAVRRRIVRESGMGA